MRRVARSWLFLHASMRVLRGTWIPVLLALGVALALPCHALFATEPSETAGDAVLDTAITVQPKQKVDLDLAKWQVQACTTYVSSGAIAFTIRLIDGNPRTAFRFSGADLHPTVIVQLARNEEVHRVGAIFDPAGTAKLDVYLLNELPKNPGDVGNTRPLTWIVSQDNGDKAAINFEPMNVRYVAFRWTREKPSRSPFLVAEVSAFGVVPADQLPPALVDADVHLPEQSQGNVSDRLQIPADPPTLVVVSP
jgi:hypothetical protein